MATFFTDADTAPRPDSEIARIMKEAGLSVVAHDERFEERTADYRWLRMCGEEGLIAVTKDQRIRYCWRAKLSIMRGGAKLFVMVGEGRTHEQLGRNFVNSVRSIVRLADRHEGPLIARVYWAGDDAYARGKPGEVNAWLTYEHWVEMERARDEAVEQGRPPRRHCR